MVLLLIMLMIILGKKQENKMNEKKFTLDNFIGVYDNYITKTEFNAIKLYEEQNKFNNTINRLKNRSAAKSNRGKGDQVFLEQCT